MERFTKEVGIVLRKARRERGLTLRDVNRLSHARFKPSSVAGYERGERSISLERFCALASFYGVLPDRLLSRVLRRLDPEGRRELLVDLTRLKADASEEARLLRELVRDVQAARGDHGADVITFRSGDLQVLVVASGKEPAQLLEALKESVRPIAEPPSGGNVTSS